MLPRFGRLGLGRLLVKAVLAAAEERGYRAVTLRTYAHVPWNAPFYLSCGFVVTEPDSVFLRRLVGIEQALGLARHGARVQMTALIGARGHDRQPARDAE